MEHQIYHLPTVNFVGKSQSVINNENASAALERLSKIMTPEIKKDLLQYCDMNIKNTIHLSYIHHLDERNIETVHLVGVMTSKDDFEDETIAIITVPPCTWLAFPSNGLFPDAIHQTMNDIYLKWLPNSEYELAANISVSFTIPSGNDPKTAYSEVWIPVLEAQKVAQA